MNGNANDASGNGLHGTPANLTYGSGVIGQAGVFNGTSSRIVLPAGVNAALDGKAAMTFCGRFKLGSTAALLRMLFGLAYPPGSNKIGVGISAARKLQVSARSKATDSLQTVLSVDSFTDTTDWHHLAAVVNVGANTNLIYLDGSPVATTGTPSYGQATFAAGTYFETLGSSGAAYWWLGTIDDARMYDVELPAWQIAALAADRSGALCPWQCNNLIQPVFQQTIQPFIGV